MITNYAGKLPDAWLDYEIYRNDLSVYVGHWQLSTRHLTFQGKPVTHAKTSRHPLAKVEFPTLGNHVPAFNGCFAAARGRTWCDTASVAVFSTLWVNLL